MDEVIVNRRRQLVAALRRGCSQNAKKLLCVWEKI